MSLEATLEQNLKAALLAKDERKVSTLRMIKSVLLNAKVAERSRNQEMADDKIIAILSKEAKKRQESADMYRQGGNETKANDELAEKAIIEAYLPAQLSEDELGAIVDDVIASMGDVDPSKMGQVIGAVKQKAGASADGAMIAKLVKERLTR